MQDTLGSETLVTIGTVTGVMVMAIGLTWKVSKISTHLSDTLDRLADAIQDRIEKREVVHWIRLIKAKNPDLDIPDFPDFHEAHDGL